SFHRTAYQLVREHHESRLLDWLGMELRPTPQGLLVVNVRQGFQWSEFMQKYDRPPLDNKVTLEEAKAGGLSEAEFKKIDRNHDKVISRAEAEEHDHLPGFAAAAGIKDGDVVVAVEGLSVKSVDAFAAAWRRDTPSVPVTVA